MWGYIKKSAVTITRIYTMLKPLRVFLTIGFISILIGLLTGGRYLYFWAIGQGNGHIQSLIFSAIVIIVGVQSIFFAFIADAIAANRKVNDEILYRIKKLEYAKFENTVDCDNIVNENSKRAV